MKLFNNDIEISFDEKGSIVEIRDVRLNRNYITETVFSNLFRLFSPKGNWQGRHADSRTQTEVDIIRKSDVEALLIFRTICFQKRKIRFAFNVSDTDSSGQQEDGLVNQNILCKVLIKIAGEEIHASMTIENNSPEVITDVMFPIVSGFGKECDGMDILWPVQTQTARRIYPNPLQNLGGNNHKEWFTERRFLQVRYPMELATAWMDFADSKGGISFDIRSHAPRIFDFGIQKVILKDARNPKNNKIALFMTQQYYPIIACGEKWESPLCIIRVHTDDWHGTAKSHRRFLESVLQRPQTPEVFQKSLGWHFFLMKLQDGTEIRNFDDLERMAESAKEAGIGYIMLFGLYTNGHDNDYDMTYSPNEEWGGAKAFVEAVRKVKAMGVAVIPFFNGTLMDSRLLETRPDLLDMCVKGRTGSRYGGQDWSRPTFDLPHTSYKGYTTTRNNMLYEICITSRCGSEWFKNTVKRLSTGLETGNIQLDQLAHKSFICYDAEHGHRSPQEAYTSELSQLLQEIRHELRTYNPEGIMIGEGFSDLAASYCDGFWNWNQLEHPHIVRYSVPWMKFSSEIDALDYKEVNFCFANGILLDLKIEGGAGIVSDFPEFQRHLKKLADLKIRLFSSYATGDFEDEDFFSKECSSAVISKIFLNSQTRKGSIIMANISDVPESIRIRPKMKWENIRQISYDCKEAAFNESEAIMLSGYEVCALEFDYQP